MKTRPESPQRKPAGTGVLCCLGLAAWFFMPVAATAAAPVASGSSVRQAPSLAAGQSTHQVTAWIRETGNNHGKPFAIIDKKAAMLHVFDGAGKPLGASPVLLGLAVGDDSVPGIGERKISDIRPAERTTPAGRFVSEPGRNLQGEDIVWIDYDAAVSMHRVRASNKADRRLERLATPTAADNRISYGCVNVPAAFYDALIKPVFGVRPAVIYVLPETRPAATLFSLATRTASSSAQVPAKAP
ncbi:MAG: L,D-transpeptidase [Polaromonas sp.]